MKIKVVSDLHLEFERDPSYFSLPFDGEEVLLLPGDVQVGLKYDKWFVNLLKDRHVIYCPGNHEYYHHDVYNIDSGLEAFANKVNQRAKAKGYKYELTILQNSSLIVGDYMFFGGTLWTNFNKANPIAMWTAERGMSDFQCVTYKGNKWTPSWALNMHEAMVENLKLALTWAKENNKKAIVLSHHAPSYQSIARKYANDSLNYAYASDLDQLVDQTVLWVHGHMHDSFDYTVGDGRVICNPRGYVGYELNKTFNPHLVIDI